MSDSSLKRPTAFLPALGWNSWPEHDQVVLTGTDRAKFLHNFCTNDIKKLQPGQGCEAFLTSIKGRILGHIFVFANEGELFIDAMPSELMKIRDHLEKYLITEDVQIAVTNGRHGAFYLFGSDVQSAVASLLGPEAASLSPVSEVICPKTNAFQTAARVRRFDVTGCPGFQVLFQDLNDSDSDGELPPLLQGCEVDDPSFGAFRIDAGFPWYGIDLTDDHLAQEAARTAKAISFTKGCYLGQEPIARLDALGHVNRELRVVAFDDAEALAAPCKVLDASTKAELGTLTSVGRVPESATVGLGMLRTSAQPGTSIIASTDKGDFQGQVVTPQLVTQQT